MEQIFPAAAVSGLPDAVENRIGQVGRRLSEAFRALIDAMPGGPYRPQELARALGVKKDLSSRVFRATRSGDPIAVVHLMPGPVPLRQLVEAAAGKSIHPDIVLEAQAAIRDFDVLIRRDAGDRASLDAIISSCLPDAREKFELFHKQAVFRGIAQLKGTVTDVTVCTALLNPSENGEMLDGVWMAGFLGLRRIRPNAVVHTRSDRTGPSATDRSPLTLDREPVESLRGLLLEQFCSKPLPTIQAHQHGTAVHYSLAGNAIGPNSAVDLFFAELTTNCMRRYRLPNRNLFGPSSDIAIPTRTLIFDVLLHEDVYPGSYPELLIYDTAINGIADLTDASREIDRLDVFETVHALGRDSSKWRATEVPRYVETVQHVLGRLGWSHERFRGYRCRIQYPIYGSQIYLAFTAPDKP